MAEFIFAAAPFVLTGIGLAAAAALFGGNVEMKLGTKKNGLTARNIKGSLPSASSENN